MHFVECLSTHKHKRNQCYNARQAANAHYLLANHTYTYTYTFKYKHICTYICMNVWMYLSKLAIRTCA